MRKLMARIREWYRNAAQEQDSEAAVRGRVLAEVFR